MGTVIENAVFMSFVVIFCMGGLTLFDMLNGFS